MKKQILLKEAKVLTSIADATQGAGQDSVQGTVLILKEGDGERRIQIPISSVEAVVILSNMRRRVSERPITHSLIANIINGLELDLTKAVITEMRDGIFHAVLVFNKDGREIAINSRPIDVVAAAAGLGKPIYANEEALLVYAEREPEKRK